MTIDHADDQVDEVRDAADADELGDSSDLIVGTIRPPGWLARIPALAWLFVGLAAADVAYRLWNAFRLGLEGMSPTGLTYLLVSVVTGAATVLLPAAVVVGCRGLDRGGRWLLQGAVALAAAELFRLVAQDVLAWLAGPAADNSGAGSFATDYVVRLLVVQVPFLVLRMFGLAKIGLGLGSIAEPMRPLGRIVWGLIVATLATILVTSGVTLQLVWAGAVTDTPLFAYDLFVLAAGLIVAGLWGWVASIAARRGGRPWPTVLAAALAILLGSGIQALGGLLALERGGTDDALTILTWSGLVAVALGAVGTVLLVAAFATGFEPGDAAGSDDAGAGGEAMATDVPGPDAEL
jgi:hypothetical protein